MVRCRVLVVSKGKSFQMLDVPRSGSANVIIVISAEVLHFAGFISTVGTTYEQAPLNLQAKVRSP